MHQQPHGQGQGQGQHGGYPYGGHPYYSSPYYTAYMNQYQYGQQGGFGGPFSKGGMYGQPHAGGYGMPQTSYDQHSSSPAMVGGFGGREAALGGGIGSEYSRSGSAQPAQGQQHSVAAAGFGNTPDVFARGQGSYPGQSQQYGQPQSGQQTSAEDSLKPFGEKASGGPSPSSIGQPGRPTSAANNTAQAGQSTLPPPQSHQQGFGGGYPSHLSGQASQQYGAGLSNLGGHQGQGGQQQSHQAGGYGNYGAGFGGNSYGGGQGGGSYGRGGWGTNYGH
jgi:hypothetical protein